MFYCRTDVFDCDKWSAVLFTAQCWLSWVFLRVSSALKFSKLCRHTTDWLVKVLFESFVTILPTIHWWCARCIWAAALPIKPLVNSHGFVWAEINQEDGGGERLYGVIPPSVKLPFSKEQNGLQILCLIDWSTLLSFLQGMPLRWSTRLITKSRLKKWRTSGRWFYKWRAVKLCHP